MVCDPVDDVAIRLGSVPLIMGKWTVESSRYRGKETNHWHSVEHSYEWKLTRNPEVLRDIPTPHYDRDALSR